MISQIKTEVWNGHKIRFVYKRGEWWAVLADAAEALRLKTFDVRRRLHKAMVSTHTLETAGGPQEMLIVNELGIYKTIFQSRKPEAIEFQNWVFQTIRTLRQSSGLEGFQVFRMMDKDFQMKCHDKLQAGIISQAPKTYIKANTIADKAVSTLHGYPKMLKKHEMTPQMLVDRQPILADTVELMCMVDKFALPISVSDTIYSKYAH